MPEIEPASRPRRGPVQIIARLRVALGFTCGVLVLWLATPTRTTITAGLAVAVVGEGFRFWAAGHLNKSREVTRSGPYRFVAHPLYVGSSVIGAGLAVASGRVAVAAIVAAYLAITLTAATTTRTSARASSIPPGGSAWPARWPTASTVPWRASWRPCC